MTTQVDPKGLFARLWGRLRRSGTQADNWSAGKGYTISVPPGKWTIGQKITLKQNGDIKTTYPVITATKKSRKEG